MVLHAISLQVMLGNKLWHLLVLVDLVLLALAIANLITGLRSKPDLGGLQLPLPLTNPVNDGTEDAPADDAANQTAVYQLPKAVRTLSFYHRMIPDKYSLRAVTYLTATLLFSTLARLPVIYVLSTPATLPWSDNGTLSTSLNMGATIAAVRFLPLAAMVITRIIVESTTKPLFNMHLEGILNSYAVDMIDSVAMYENFQYGPNFAIVHPTEPIIRSSVLLYTVMAVAVAQLALALFHLGHAVTLRHGKMVFRDMISQHMTGSYLRGRMGRPVLIFLNAVILTLRLLLWTQFQVVATALAMKNVLVIGQTLISLRRVQELRDAYAKGSRQERRICAMAEDQLDLLRHRLPVAPIDWKRPYECDWIGMYRPPPECPLEDHRIYFRVHFPPKYPNQRPQLFLLTKLPIPMDGIDPHGQMLFRARKSHPSRSLSSLASRLRMHRTDSASALNFGAPGGEVAPKFRVEVMERKSIPGIPRVQVTKARRVGPRRGMQSRSATPVPDAGPAQLDPNSAEASLLSSQSESSSSSSSSSSSDEYSESDHEAISEYQWSGDEVVDDPADLDPQVARARDVASDTWLAAVPISAHRRRSLAAVARRAHSTRPRSVLALYSALEWRIDAHLQLWAAATRTGVHLPGATPGDTPVEGMSVPPSRSGPPSGASPASSGARRVASAGPRVISQLTADLAQSVDDVAAPALPLLGRSPLAALRRRLRYKTVPHIAPPLVTGRFYPWVAAIREEYLRECAEFEIEWEMYSQRRDAYRAAKAAAKAKREQSRLARVIEQARRAHERVQANAGVGVNAGGDPESGRW
ncbi:hypothetical protein AMAG_07736 [Allomyces macrogynus ATCC 38327]|uniref:Uncharacterized protein n=1 Tax=Allomyces macrogynus (strain ATCC 38327) TaxID=578462 RepID=A0A0L0SJB4_ALLM3|nr:hypothetical protein AMAG_07736 [Allomyces macrogynus ATCC 38327]|eukprot:KNE62524.1 hypothetical protein AMAG_07736 [Allomyces macrogynus ATCC 38327]